jgi:putative exosortase-associated protein (TIGR04073 family)
LGFKKYTFFDGGLQMTIKMKRVLGLVVLALLLGSWTAYAVYDARYDSKEDLKGQFESGTGEKLTRGVTNVLFGWMEIAQTPAKMAAGIERNAATAFLLGVPYGVVRFAKRTVVGCYEVATCYAPQSPIMPNLQGEVV